jgi:uncharacterized protein (DUF849 family)
VVERIRAQNRDLIINLTTGEGGRFTASEHDPKVAAPGNTLSLAENRAAHVVAIKPDICSLDFTGQSTTEIDRPVGGSGSAMLRLF